VLGVMAALLLLGWVNPSHAEEPAWAVVAQDGGLTIYQRPHPGSDLQEFKAVGVIQAPTDAVKRVLEDVEAHPQFMPYLKEVRVLSRDAKSRVSYQRVSPPLIGDRDYTVRVTFDTRRTPEGSFYSSRWQAANDVGPPVRKGITRVIVTQGSWQLEPAEGGRATRAIYQIFSDPEGSVPTAIVNAGSRSAIPKLFAGLRKRVLLPKYSTPQ